jgi:hypothetical protein
MNKKKPFDFSQPIIDLVPFRVVPKEESPTPEDESPTLALMREHGIEPTLDNWLEFNGVADVLDGELLDALPAEFRDEYRKRIRARRDD